MSGTKRSTPTSYDLLAAPFVDYQFMRRALVGALALALAGSPLGASSPRRGACRWRWTPCRTRPAGRCDGSSRRRGLVAAGDAGRRAAAGLAAPLALRAPSALSALREAASLAAFYLVSLALGVTIVPPRFRPPVRRTCCSRLGPGARRRDAAAARRRLDADAVFAQRLSIARWSPTRSTPGFWAARAGSASRSRFCFGVGGAQSRRRLSRAGHADGGGPMMLPAAAAKLWTRDLSAALPLAGCLGALASYVGLVLSFYSGDGGAGDHSGRGRRVFRVAVPWPRRRADPQSAPTPAL